MTENKFTRKRIDYVTNQGNIILSNKKGYASDEGKYEIYKNGIDCVQIFIHHTTKFNKKSLTDKIIEFGHKFLAIKGGNKDNLYSFIHYVNDNHTQPFSKITEDDIINLIDKIFFEFNYDNIKKTSKKVIFSNKAKDLYREELKSHPNYNELKNDMYDGGNLMNKEIIRLMQRDTAIECNKLNKEKTILFLSDEYFEFCTQKQLSQLTGKSIRTIKRYWTQIKDNYIKRLEKMSVEENVESNTNTENKKCELKTYISEEKSILEILNSETEIEYYTYDSEIDFNYIQENMIFPLQE